MNVASDLWPLIIVWNALKTSRKVLGADMPESDVAQEMEQRTEKILIEGSANAERLQTRGDETKVNALLAALKDGIQRCR